MARERSALEELRSAVLDGQLDRRQVLRRALALGLSAPVIAGLLAACGDDDDDDDDTPTNTPEGSGGGDEPTATEEAGDEPTEAEGEPTEAEGEPTEAEAEPTEAEGEPTEAEGEPTEAEGGAGQSWEGGDRLMGKDIEEAGSTGGVLIEGGFSDISTLSPIMSNDTTSSNVQAFIFESLVEPNPDTLEPVGLLAESWSVSEDGLTWTFNLRDGVMWHDGEALTADDVVFTYNLHMTEEVNSPRFSDFTGKIESVEAADESTVVFTAKQINPDFALDLAIYGIIPQHVWEDVAPADHAASGGATGEDPSMVVGTGPFIFDEWLVEDRVTLTANADYWDGAPNLDSYIYVNVADQATLVQQLKTGDVDYGSVNEAAVVEFDNTDVTIYDYPTLNFTFYGTQLDTEKSTLFQDVEVRHALLYALDREAMIEAIRFGYGEVAVGTFPVLSWAYNPDGIDEDLRFPYDPDKARELLDSAGWTEGDNGVREKDGTPLSFTMYTNAGNTVREQYLTIMQEQWSEIGVEMTPQLEPFPALVERITETFDFEVFLIGFNWSVPPDQSPMWATDSYPLGFNIVKYSNPEVDSLLEEALSELDQDRRVEIYTEFQNVLLQDLPMAVLDFPQGIRGVNQRAHNVFPNSVNRTFNVETWWIES
ncbi:MAG: ABC transporter substrate-binding protein [Thermomicrobiales bacterium]